MEKQTQNRAGRLRAGLLSLLAVAALAGLDQLIKAWAVAVLQPRGSMPFLPGVVELQFVLNDGMAFSMLSGCRGLLLGATGLILAALLLILLLVRALKVDHIREKSDFLLSNMAFFFIPAGVSIINYFYILAGSLVPLLVICLVSTLLTFAVTAWAVQLTRHLMDRRKK